MVDRTAECGAFRSVPHISLEIRNRASLPISQTAHGTQLQSFAQSGERSAMGVAVCLGLLAIAADTRSSEAQSSGLVSQQSGSMHHAHAVSGATFGFCIFVGVGHTGLHSQTCRKRRGQTQKLLPGSAYSLSGDLQEQKGIQITGCQSIIGICFSVFKVQFDCTFFGFYLATLKSSK